MSKSNWNELVCIEGMVFYPGYKFTDPKEYFNSEICFSPELEDYREIDVYEDTQILKSPFVLIHGWKVCSPYYEYSEFDSTVDAIGFYDAIGEIDGLLGLWDDIQKEIKHLRHKSCDKFSITFLVHCWYEYDEWIMEADGGFSIEGVVDLSKVKVKEY